MRALISVVNVTEAHDAVRAGAEIVDVKEPREGSLGAQHPLEIRAIRQLVPKEVELSVTLGDFPFLPNSAAQAALAVATLGADYVKIGLLGCRQREEVAAMAHALGRVVGELPATRLVVGCYADYREVGSVAPLEVLAGVEEAPVAGILVDTARKDGRGLFSHCRPDELSELVAAAHQRGLFCALAGSLKGADLPRLHAIGADIAGFRGALCDGGRDARLQPERVRQLLAKLHELDGGAELEVAV